MITILVAFTVYLGILAAMQRANDSNAGGWPEATADVHLNKAPKGRQVLIEKEF